MVRCTSMNPILIHNHLDYTPYVFLRDDYIIQNRGGDIVAGMPRPKSCADFCPPVALHPHSTVNMNKAVGRKEGEEELPILGNFLSITRDAMLTQRITNPSVEVAL